MEGPEPATEFRWYKNGAPVLIEPGRMRIKTELRSTPQVLVYNHTMIMKTSLVLILFQPLQWSMFKINKLETLDTAFFRCEASNAVESVHSDAYVQVFPRYPGCPHWSKNAEENLEFVGKENEEGEVMTTLWLKLEALSPKCTYTKDEKNFSITISNIATMEMKRKRNKSDRTARKDLIQNQDINPFAETKSVPKSSRPRETSLESLGESKPTGKHIPVPNSKLKQAPKPCHNDADSEKELSKIALKGPTLRLKRWREYNIEVVFEVFNADLNTYQKTEVKTFTHNTYRWVCPGSCHQTISQTEFCDGVEHCPGGADESKKNCEVSQLPQKTAYGFYGYMLFVITIYWMFMSSNNQENGESAPEITQDVEDFQKEVYKQRHTNDNSDLAIEVKEGTFDKLFDIDDIQANEICKKVKEAEIEVHENAQEAYDCVLKHYGGDHPITARLVDPTGGFALKVKKCVNMRLNSNTQWFSLNIVTMFIFLCLHHFDYIKDIGKRHIRYLKNLCLIVSDISVILDHFDQRVIQSAYEPYNGFNFHYLFLTSVCLICVSHIVNFIYWTVRRHVNPMVNTNVNT